MYSAQDTVKDVLEQHPKAFTVFERHGMCDDCKQSPPPVSLAHFATKHCDGQIDQFVAELNTYIAQ